MSKIANALAISATLLVLTGCGGSTDPRMVGRWESRRGFANSLEVEFRGNGKLAVKSIESSGSKSHSGRWQVEGGSGDELTIRMKTGGSYQVRKVKFLNEDFFVMTASGGRTLGRFKRME